MFPNNFYDLDSYRALGGASEDSQSSQNSPQYGVSGTGMGAYSMGFPSYQQPQGGAFSSSAREIYDALPVSHYPYGSFGVRSPEVNCEELVSTPESIDLDSVLQGETLSSAEGPSLTLSSPSPALVSPSMRGSGQVVTPPFTEAQFLRAIRVLAQGASRGKAARHATIEPDLFRHYLGSNNKLTEQGKAYVASLLQSVQQDIHRELESSSYGGSQEVGGAEQAESPQRVTFNPTVRAFMNMLPHYASGMRVNKCGELSDLKAVYSYFANLGLRRDGVRLYNRLPQPMKDRVDAAIEARRHALFEVSGLSVNQECFLRALEPFALGAPFQECEEQANWMWMRSFVSTKGVLTARGKRLLDSLPPDALAKVNDALTARQAWYATLNLSVHAFCVALELFARTKCSVEEISSRVGGLEPGILGLVLCDAGLTDAGRRYVHEMLTLDLRGFVNQRIACRRHG